MEKKTVHTLYDLIRCINENVPCEFVAKPPYSMSIVSYEVGPLSLTTYDDLLTRICAALHSDKTLTDLYVTIKNDQNMKDVFDLLMVHPCKMVTLDVDNVVGFTRQICTSIAKIMSNTKTLTDIRLNGPVYDQYSQAPSPTEGFDLICSALVDNKTLVSVNLFEALRTYPEGFTQLSQALMKNKSIKYLDLSFGAFEHPEFLEQFLINTHSESLSSVYFQSFKSSHIKSMAQFLRNNVNLECLQMFPDPGFVDCKGEDRPQLQLDLKELEKAMVQHPNIKVLNVEYNVLPELIGNVMAQTKQIKLLDLRTTDAALNQIAQLSHGNTSLVELNVTIDSNSTKAESVPNIINAWSNLVNLKVTLENQRRSSYIYYDESTLDDKLANAVKNHSCLKKLVLEGMSSGAMSGKDQSSWIECFRQNRLKVLCIDIDMSNESASLTQFGSIFKAISNDYLDMQIVAKLSLPKVNQFREKPLKEFITCPNVRQLFLHLYSVDAESFKKYCQYLYGNENIYIWHLLCSSGVRLEEDEVSQIVAAMFDNNSALNSFKVTNWLKSYDAPNNLQQQKQYWDDMAVVIHNIARAWKKGHSLPLEMWLHIFRFAQYPFPGIMSLHALMKKIFDKYKN